MTGSTEPTEPAGPAVSTPALDLPAPSEVPRESAVDTRELGSDLLARVMVWYTAAVETAAVADVLEVRRRLAVLAALIERRGLSAAGALDAAQALCLVERLAGRRMVAAGVEARDLRGEHPHEVVKRCWFYGQLDGRAFAAALATARAGGSLAAADADAVADAVDAVVGAVVAGAASPVEPAAPPAWTAAKSHAALSDVLTGLGGVAIGDMDPYTLEPEEAADAARELWDLLVPLVGLHTHLTAHGHGRRIRPSR